MFSDKQPKANKIFYITNSLPRLTDFKKGILSLAEKLHAIKSMAPLKYQGINNCEALLGNYRNHMNHYSDITQQLTRLLHKDLPCTWIDKQENSLEEINKCLKNPPILIDPV